MFTPDVVDLSRRSVLCWLATADERGQPNVSPKEIFCLRPPDGVAIAHIASPASVRNVRRHPQVCVAFVDVFVQKGVKLHGTASVILPSDPGYADWAAPLLERAGPRFRIHGVIAVRVSAVEPIIAPSYRFHPDETTEASQVAAAMRSYGVRPLAGETRESAEAVVREFWRLMATNDFHAVAAVLAPDFVMQWPQSGETIRGAERFCRMNAEYPATGRWQFRINRLVADGDSVVTQVSVSDGAQHAEPVSFFTVAAGRITRLVEYWPEPFAPAANRRHLVESGP